MTRYAIIDNHTGFVWGVTDATSPVNACIHIDSDIDPSAAAVRHYQEYPATSRVLTDGASGYHVYTVPAGFDVYDGQARDAMAAVVAHNKTALVTFTDSELA